MTYRVAVCGNSSAGVPPAGGAGSGYLVEHERTRLLVDCGNGVLGNLRKFADYGDVTAVYVTHLHADHCADLLALALEARFMRRKLVTYGPEGLRTLLYRWFSLFHAAPDPYVEALAPRELKPWETVTVGDLRVQALPVEHNVPCLALRAEPLGGGARFVFTGDTKAGALAIEAAQGADLLLAEATYQDLPPGREPEATRAHHMTAREAGQVARAAGAKRLLLTHMLYTADPAASVAQARAEFDGPVDYARVGERFEVSK